MTDTQVMAEEREGTEGIDMTNEQALRKALEPFAKYADAVLKRRDGAEPEPVPDDRLVFGMDGQHISIGDLRRARSALATPPSVPAQQGEDDWGCEYCRNDGCLNENNCCPKCDAQYEEDAATTPDQTNEVTHG